MLRIDPKLLAAASLMLGLLGITATAAIVAKPKPEPVTADAVVGVIVTDSDLRAILHSRRAATALNTGPFDGPDTVQLYVVTVFDRTQLGTAMFDQVATFVLPDGNVYETRVDPVDPTGVRGTVVREDLSPEPIETLPVVRAKRLARVLPDGLLSGVLPKNAALVAIPLPVSGTWITGHGLYGTWQVQISAVKDDKVISSRTTSFTIDDGR